MEESQGIQCARVVIATLSSPLWGPAVAICTWVANAPLFSRSAKPYSLGEMTAISEVPQQRQAFLFCFSV